MIETNVVVIKVLLILVLFKFEVVLSKFTSSFNIKSFLEIKFSFKITWQKLVLFKIWGFIGYFFI